MEEPYQGNQEDPYSSSKQKTRETSVEYEMPTTKMGKNGRGHEESREYSRRSKRERSKACSGSGDDRERGLHRRTYDNDSQHSLCRYLPMRHLSR